MAKQSRRTFQTSWLKLCVARHSCRCGFCKVHTAKSGCATQAFSLRRKVSCAACSEKFRILRADDEAGIPQKINPVRIA
jgi:hypothetical protein